MRVVSAIAACLISVSALASGPKDFARQWPALGDCPGTVQVQSRLQPPLLDCEGAFALLLDESVYRQVQSPDLGDIAAFNAAGDALAFGPMPPSYVPPPRSWREAAWFALPGEKASSGEDLHLHVIRTPAGELSLDASLSRGIGDAVQDILVDVRNNDSLVEAIELELALDAADFSVQVSLEASEDLQHWRTIVPAATIAQLRQGRQALVRRNIEFTPLATRYLRLRVLGGPVGIALRSLRLLVHPRNAVETLARESIAAGFVRRDGRAYVYKLSARVPVERINVGLGDDNATANFSISARQAGEPDWHYIGQLTAFRLRAAGVLLDNPPMDVVVSRWQEWRIEPNIELTRTPLLELGYRPEAWLLLTHGKPPYVVAAGSSIARRGSFPLEALVGQVRSRYGRDWQPAPASLGAMQTAGGEQALTARAPGTTRAWLLWAVLLLGAATVIVMVLRLLREPREP